MLGYADDIDLKRRRKGDVEEMFLAIEKESK